MYQLQEISKLFRTNLNIAMRRFRSKTLAKRRYKPAKMRTITFCSGHRRHPFDIKFGSFVHENSSVAVTMTCQKLYLAKQKETAARPRPTWMNYIDNWDPEFWKEILGLYGDDGRPWRVAAQILSCCPATLTERRATKIDSFKKILVILTETAFSKKSIGNDR